ncbi:50S ribosomal protein L33, partial [Desemzia sp. FAM 23991]
MKKKMILACTDCGSRNYSKDGGAKVRTERLEVK